MKMRATLMGLTAAMALYAGVAAAAITAADVRDTYVNGGYTGIEVVDGDTTVTVEAIKDGVKMEVTYDKASGGVIRTESTPVTAGTGTSGSGATSGTDSADAADDSSDDDQASGSDDSGDEGADDNSDGNDSGGDGSDGGDSDGGDSGGDSDSGSDD